MTLVKIGSRYLNLDLMTEIRDTGMEIEIFFESEKATVLRGADAERLRVWLADQADDLGSEEDSE
jgi:hypothetical protein